MFECAMASAVGLIGSNARLAILKGLMNGPLSMTKLKKLVPDVGAEDLTALLCSMQNEGLITQQGRQYVVTDFARNMAPVLGLLNKWSQ